MGAVSPHTGVTDAAAAAVAALEAACAPLAPYIPELLEPWESLWDVVLAVEEQPGAWRYARLNCHRYGDGLRVDPQELVPAPGRVQALALGAPHPALQVLDFDYHHSYQQRVWAAQVARTTTPPAAPP